MSGTGATAQLAHARLAIKCRLTSNRLGMLAGNYLGQLFFARSALRFWFSASARSSTRSACARLRAASLRFA